jgi:hypothetical protein
MTKNRRTPVFCHKSLIGCRITQKHLKGKKEHMGMINSPHAFRSAEVSQLFQWVKLGESGSIIGVSNVGKSALFQHLLDADIQYEHLTNDKQNYLFVRVNLHNLPDFQNRSVYSLILDQMEVFGSAGNVANLSAELFEKIGIYHEQLLESGSDELKIQRFFKLAVCICLKEPALRLVFLFDQFDQLYKNGQDSLFYNLRGLHDAYPNRIMYLFFSRHPLPDLPLLDQKHLKQGSSQDDETGHEARLLENTHLQAREELYELVQSNQLYLKPYTEADSEEMLQEIARRNRERFDETLAKRLYALTCGHAGLLRSCYMHALRNGNDLFLQKNNLAEILGIETVAEECEKIWVSLGENEQIAMVAQVRNLPVHFADTIAERRLEWKGMLTRIPENPLQPGPAKPYTIFSPIVEQFVRKQNTSLDRPIYLDWKSHVIYVFGKPAEPLSKTEYIAFKTLYEQENSLVSLESLYQLCYPDEAFDKTHSPSSLATMMSRIRQKLHITESDGLLQAKHKQGYILRNRPKEEGLVS